MADDPADNQRKQQEAQDIRDTRDDVREVKQGLAKLRSDYDSQVPWLVKEVPKKMNSGSFVGKDGIKVVGDIIRFDSASASGGKGESNNQQVISVNLIVNGVQEVHEFYETGIVT